MAPTQICRSERHTTSSCRRIVCKGAVMTSDRRSPRIALGALFSETSHFLTTTAGLDHWRNTYVLAGNDIFSLRGATCEEAGAFNVLDAAGVDLLPLLAARAVSSGPTTEEAY